MNVADLRSGFRTLVAIIAKPSPFVGTLLLLAAPAMGADLSANWPQFRGPGALGVADTYVFQASPDYKLLHTNSLDEMCLATPAIAGDRLLIRTLTKLYCFQAAK